ARRRGPGGQGEGAGERARRVRSRRVYVSRTSEGARRRGSRRRPGVLIGGGLDGPLRDLPQEGCGGKAAARTEEREARGGSEDRSERSRAERSRCLPASRGRGSQGSAESRGQ